MATSSASTQLLEPTPLPSMQPRKCKFCERRFVKAEHLKRHQRSHTGEKPYKCPECVKSFSRSDVLSRHLKAHTQQNAVNTNTNDTIDEEDEETLSISEQDHGDAQDKGPPQDPPEDIEEVLIQSPILSPETQPMHLLPNHHQEVPASYTDLPSLHQAPLSDARDHFTQNSNQQSNWTSQGMDMAGVRPQTSRSHPIEHMSGISPVNQIDQWHSEQPRPSTLIHNSAGIESNNLGGDPNPSQSLFQLGMMPGDGGFTIPDDFQLWFNHLDRNMPAGPGNILLGSRATTMPDMASYAPISQNSVMPLQTPLRNLESVDFARPNERFIQAEQYWPHKSAGRSRMMHTLWRDVCHNSQENLFSEPTSFSDRASPKPNGCSRRGLDDEVRDRLEMAFSRLHTARDLRDGTVDSGGTQSEHSDEEQRTRKTFSDSIKFPPAEIFDMGLDLYFRHFHPLYPFIHLPTFHPKTTNTSLLYVMCLIGLTLINSRGVVNFVHQEMDIIFEVVESELSSYTLYPHVRSDQVLSTMASGILVVALTEILGGKINQSRTRRLYVQINLQCQEQRLFAVEDSEPLNEITFESFQNIDLRWKAWSRVESAKRLITTTLLVDAWRATTQNTCPILRTDNLQFLLPCDAVLFQCKSASKWHELLSKGHQMFTPVVALYPQHATVPRIARPMDTLAMQGILSLIRLRICENYHRLLSGSHKAATETTLVPWQTFTTDPQARVTQALVVEVMEAYGDMLRQMNPNCMALWHNTCIMLTTDLRIFEQGAGSAGPSNARQALNDIAIWTQTRAARRAILHAAQTFKIMSHRRASDGDPFHLCYGLFVSALVLALYVYTVPPHQNNEEDESASFELLDDIDWRRVGSEGLAFSTDYDYVDDAAVNFIICGGSISLDGVVHPGGYQSACRILVDFVQLLDEVGKWRAGRYTHILRIMSDALADDEALAFHS